MASSDFLIQYNLRFQWAEDILDRVVIELASVRATLKETIVPMEEAVLIVLQDYARRFAAKEDQQGVAWEEWQPAYALDAEIVNVNGILERTDEMYDALLNAVRASDTGVSVELDELPEYAQTQDQGGGNAVPARPFLEISEEAKIAIEALWIDWAEATIEGGITLGKRGKVGVRRGSRGRFAPLHPGI